MIILEGENFYTLQEASEKIGKNIQTLRKWIKEGKLKAKKVGVPYYVKEADLKKLFEKG